MSANGHPDQTSHFCPPLDNLINASRTPSSRHYLKWVRSKASKIEVFPLKAQQTLPLGFYKYQHKTSVILLLIGSRIKCMQDYIDEFSKIYSLPTSHYASQPFNSVKFRRYSTLLVRRNRLIKGFTEIDNNLYMVAQKRFYSYYFRYGFCSVCGILRCSSVWCICGHRQFSNGWTSNNERLDKFIRDSQQTESANDAYLEWIPFDSLKRCQDYSKNGYELFIIVDGLPTYNYLILIPLEITDETNDTYYAKLCVEHEDMVKPNDWLTIGFTYHNDWGKYALIKVWNSYSIGLCLACTETLNPNISAFCYYCKTPRPLGWTTRNRNLDSFIMSSWKNMDTMIDGYIQWVNWNQLINVQRKPFLSNGCTHTAMWLGPNMDTGVNKNQLIRVTLKRINTQNVHSFDFNQLTKDYPLILSSHNNWIIGITQRSLKGDYYLVFYYEMYPLFKKFIQIINFSDFDIKFIPFDMFHDIQVIGSGGYGTVYIAKCKNSGNLEYVSLKRYRRYYQLFELFMSEVRNHASCSNHSYRFLEIYGITQQPQSKEYMIVMQHANGGSLYSYLDRNINHLTWKAKIACLRDIAENLATIHEKGLIHCDLHGGNILFEETSHGKNWISSFHAYPYICDLGLSKPVNLSKSDFPTIQGVLAYIAPEVLLTRTFTQKSDIYSFGIIMHQMASGEPPYKELSSDILLAYRICEGLRPDLPEPIPKEYRELARICCDADSNKRPTAEEIYNYLCRLVRELENNNSDDNIWNKIYRNDHLKPLTLFEKERKYSSRLLPTESLCKSRNCWYLNPTTAGR